MLSRLCGGTTEEIVRSTFTDGRVLPRTRLNIWTRIWKQLHYEENVCLNDILITKWTIPILLNQFELAITNFSVCRILSNEEEAELRTVDGEERLRSFDTPLSFSYTNDSFRWARVMFNCLFALYFQRVTNKQTPTRNPIFIFTFSLHSLLLWLIKRFCNFWLFACLTQMIVALQRTMNSILKDDRSHPGMKVVLNSIRESIPITGMT